MDWLKVIYEIAPRGKAAIVEALAAEMPDIVEHWEVNSHLRAAHFLAQCAHESDAFKTTVEYASGKAYDHRKDLGFVGVYAGKGALYKGAGDIQVTGPANQKACAVALGILAEWTKNPRVLAEPKYAALSAAWFWKTHGCNALADRDDILAVTKRVNGGTNGLADRKTYLARAKKAVEKYADAEGVNAPEPAPSVPEGTILPRARVAALQKALGEVYPLGKPDGIAGTLTVAAVSAFQHDSNLPVNGRFDEATIEAIEDGVGPRPVVPARRAGKPESSAILAGVRKLKIAAVTAASPAVVSLAADPLGGLEKAGGYWGRFKSAMEPFGGVADLAGSHWPILVMLGAAGVFVLAHSIGSARVADYQEGKTP